jgi:hypothetical protein
MVLGSTQPLTEMSTRNLPGAKGRHARKTDHLTAVSQSIFIENIGASTSHNLMDLQGFIQAYIYLSFVYISILFIWEPNKSLGK